MLGAIRIYSVFALLAVLYSQGAVANDLLIEKFTKIQVKLSDGDSSKVPVTLRLADMLSERARKASMKELESGCITCTAGEKDRKRALQYYKEVLPKVAVSQKGRILAQMGHLYEMTGEENKALSLYQKVIHQKDTPEVAKIEAKLSLAEAYFKKRQYEVAKKYYEQVLESPEAKRKGLAHYKVAWCEFNAGHVDLAIQRLVKVLKSRNCCQETHRE